VIVADAAPLVHLARANWLRLLPRLYTKVVVPPSAWKPVVEPNDRRPETHVLEEATESWLEIRAPPAKAERTAQALQRATPMGLGEADAIALRDPEPPQGRRAPRHRDRGVGTAEGDGDVGLAERARASALLDVEPPAQMASSHRMRRAGGACPGLTTSRALTSR